MCTERLKLTLARRKTYFSLVILFAVQTLKQYVSFCQNCNCKSISHPASFQLHMDGCMERAALNRFSRGHYTKEVAKQIQQQFCAGAVV